MNRVTYINDLHISRFELLDFLLHTVLEDGLESRSCPTLPSVLGLEIAEWFIQGRLTRF